ncbi:MAG: hypothetical protein LBM19_02525 [Holosporales bacterium]|nr:hypothetical protein [Holosporales bacterium]
MRLIHNIYLLAPAIDYTDLLKASVVKGRLALLGSIVLDKSLYKSVEISSFQKINIIGGAFASLTFC